MGEKTDKLRKKVDGLPRKPGVYLFKDDRHEVIYVGKAKDLRARVRSYWLESSDDWRLICKKIDQVSDIDVVVTASEKEALLLESNFIKQFRPKYNVNFRDDKSFVSIRINLAEPWPKPVVTRNLDNPKALYFGPYASARAARQTVRVLQDVFPLRKCSLRECRERTRPCLYGEMEKCLAPCCGEVSEEEYGRLVDQVVLFLKGKADELLAVLRSEMAAASEQQEYERAAKIRDRIEAIERTLEEQYVSSAMEEVDRDIFGLCTLDRFVAVAVLFVRNGSVRDAASYRFPADLDSEEAILDAFLKQFYSQNRFIPQEVLLPLAIEDEQLLASILTEKKGRKVAVLHPRRGTKRRLVELANRNAREAERVATTDEEKRRLEMESLQEVLGLETLPRYMECYDISTLQGREAVGSRVVFRDGRPDKSAYRHYRIRQVEGQDDFAMMREVLTRRFSKLVSRDGEGDEPPDLLIVDGGKGQLGVALAVLREHGCGACPAVGLAKARSRAGRKVRSERVFLPGRAEPVEIPEQSYGFRLITRVRDEAHRFAVSYHRKLRSRAVMESPLVEIRGVGKTLARRLLEHFGGLNKVKDADVEELEQVRGVSRLLARAIHDHYHRGAS
jgi:excinuclease ABC subunit C